MCVITNRIGPNFWSDSGSKLKNWITQVRGHGLLKLYGHETHEIINYTYVSKSQVTSHKSCFQFSSNKKKSQVMSWHDSSSREREESRRDQTSETQIRSGIFGSATTIKSFLGQFPSCHPGSLIDRFTRSTFPQAAKPHLVMLDISFCYLLLFSVLLVCYQLKINKYFMYLYTSPNCYFPTNLPLLVCQELQMFFFFFFNLERNSFHSF